jgi:hypothetical protein
MCWPAAHVGSEKRPDASVVPSATATAPVGLRRQPDRSSATFLGSRVGYARTVTPATAAPSVVFTLPSIRSARVNSMRLTPSTLGDARNAGADDASSARIAAAALADVNVASPLSAVAAVATTSDAGTINSLAGSIARDSSDSRAPATGSPLSAQRTWTR